MTVAPDAALDTAAVGRLRSRPKLIRSVALVALALTSWFACPGCIKIIRQPKEPKMLQDRIGFYKWLSASGAFKRDPALAREGARALLGLESGAAQKTRRPSVAGTAGEALGVVLRLLTVELLERYLQKKRSAAPSGGKAPLRNKQRAAPSGGKAAPSGGKPPGD